MEEDDEEDGEFEAVKASNNDDWEEEKRLPDGKLGTQVLDDLYSHLDY
jgi:hypothetical protein